MYDFERGIERKGTNCVKWDVPFIKQTDLPMWIADMDLKTAQNMSLRLNRPREDILYMPIGQEVVIRRGQRPIITRRYDIQKNELYQEITKEYNRQLKAAERERTNRNLSTLKEDEK